MFELRIEVEFSAGHHLVGYQGDCARPHGHNWKLEVFVRSTRLDSVGMAMDFRDLKAASRELIKVWDHQNLNELPDFKELNSTAENIARLAFQKLSLKLDRDGTWVSRVTVWENDRAWASYFEEGKSK